MTQLIVVAALICGACPCHQVALARRPQSKQEAAADGSSGRNARPAGTHWAFVAPQRPGLPQVRDTGWGRNAIDRFALARLEASGLRPSPEADRVTLLRRVTLDLTGLPPSPQDVDAFLADADSDAFEKVVDRLLACPRHGEHMARDWLDQARYADTHGYFTDHERFMWRWRDWVIRSFNANMPFDQFTIEQLAGDLLPDATVDQQIATGFNRNHMVTEETGVIPEEYRTEYVADRVRTTAAVWMGLSAGCAQCHDHKYDPLTQREFYQLFAYFNNVPEEGISGGKKNAAPVINVATSAEEAMLSNLRDEIKELDKKLSELKKDADPAGATATADAEATASRQRLETQRERLRNEERQLVAKTTTMVMRELDKPRDTFVLVRGQYDQPGQRVEPGTPRFLPPTPAEAAANRLGLARWIVAPDHPLTARVQANRLWRIVFGQAIVATVEDFGVQGEPPTHPELLDWLATELVQSGWDNKHLLRLMVLSATYRQSSHVTAELLRTDPRNRLLARASRYRLDAEVIRDSALFSAGLLAEQVGGPSVRPYQPADLWRHVTYDKKNTQSYDQSTGDGLFRRSLYTYWKRQVPPPTMQLLDAPTRETCVLRRQRTNTPLQALALLNETQFVEAARLLGQRMRQHAETDAVRLQFGFRLVAARSPSDRELAELLRLLDAERAAFSAKPDGAKALLTVGEIPVDAVADNCELAAWTVVGNTLLNLDESLTRE